MGSNVISKGASPVMRRTCRLTRGRSVAGPIVWRLFLLRSSRAREVKPTKAWSANVSILLCCKWSSCRRWDIKRMMFIIYEASYRAQQSCCVEQESETVPVGHGRCSPAAVWCRFVPGTECVDVRVPETCQLSPDGCGFHSVLAPITDRGSGKSQAPRLRWCCSRGRGTWKEN